MDFVRCTKGTEFDPGGRATVGFGESLLGLPLRHTGSLATRLGALQGNFILRSDGSFDPCSTVVVDLRSLASVDDPFAGIPGAANIQHRDETVHEVSLQTSRYPVATFRPATLTGTPLPLPNDGAWQVTIVGDLTIHGATKKAEWTGTLRRERANTGATLQTTVRWADYGIQIPTPPYVIQLDDHATVEVTFVAGAS